MSLFSKAKEVAPAKKVSAKEQKIHITVKEPGFFDKIKRQAFLLKEIKSYEAESGILSEEIKEVGKEKWAEVYDKDGINPESIIIEAKENNDTAQFMLLMSDKYIIIDKERAEYLKETYGEEIVSEEDTFQFEKAMIEKYGDVISELIIKSKKIAESDKEKIIKAVTTYSVKKGTVDKLKIYADKAELTVLDMVNEVRPVCSTKYVEYIEGKAIH